MAGLDPGSEIEELYRAQYEPMVRLAYLLTGSSELAGEIAQEAFLRVWPRLGDVRDPVAYTKSIVANLARGHHRRVVIERRHAPTPPGPALPAEVDELWSQLWTLPERQRAAIILRFYADLDVAGVADALGCRLGTAKSLIHRALARLREALDT